MFHGQEREKLGQAKIWAIFRKDIEISLFV
jgi:hypothetical protein